MQVIIQDGYWRQLFRISSIAILPLTPALIAVYRSERLQVSFHGFFHSAYVFQLQKGVIPPENAALPGYHANVYWLYHALLAGLSGILKAPVPFVSMMLNTVVLFVLLFLAGWILASMRLLPNNPTVAAGAILFMLFGANLFGIFYFVVRGMISGQWRIAQPGPPDIGTMILFADPRLASLFPKFLNFSGFPLGILFWLLALGVGRMMANNFTWPRFLTLSLVFLGGMAFHPTSGLFAVLVMLTSLVGCSVLTFLLPHDSRRRQGLSWQHIRTVFQHKMDQWWLRAGQWRRTLAVILLICAAAFVYTYLQWVSAAMHAPIQVFFSLTDLRSLLVVFLPTIPFFGLGTVRYWRMREVSGYFCIITALAGCSLALFLHLPDHNEYKFILLASLPFNLVVLAGFLELHHHLPRGFGALSVSRATRGIVLGFVGLNLLLVSLLYGLSGWGMDEQFTYKAGQVQYRQPAPGLQNRHVYEWIRTHTADTTLLFTRPVPKDSFVPYLLTQRLPYVLLGDIYTVGYTEATHRIEQAERFFQPTITLEERKTILKEVCSLQRPIIFVISQSDTWLDKLTTLVETELEVEGDRVVSVQCSRLIE